MKPRIFEGVGDVHPLPLQKFGTFPVKNGRARIIQTPGIVLNPWGFLSILIFRETGEPIP
jgi:hypothetical protein